MKGKTFRKAITLVGVVALAFSLVVVGCGPQQPGEEPQQRDNNLIIAGDADLDTALWTHSGLFLVDQLLTWMGEPLVWLQPDGTLEPALAEDWEISPDGTVYTFFLDPDAKFQDGTPVTARDVAFTMELTVNPEIPSGGGPSTLLVGAAEYASGEADHIAGIEIVNDHTIKMTFSVPSGQVMNILGADAILPYHILGEVPASELAEHAFNTAPIYAGPYTLVKWDKGSEMVFEKFADYYGPEVAFDKIIYRIIPEASTRIAELKAGRVDVVLNVPVTDYESVISDEGLSGFETPGPYGRHLLVNQNKPEWDNLKARQAISHAFDWAAILDGLFYGKGNLSVALFHPAEWEYNDDLDPYAYDPELAKQLLAEIGWVDQDGDGFLEAHGVEGVPDGQKLSVLLPVYDKLREDVSLILKEQLKAIGVDGEVEMYESSLFWSEVYTPGSTNWDLMFMGWGSSFVGAWPSARGMEYNFAGVGTTQHQREGWDDEELDAMIKEVLTITEQAEAKVLWNEIQERIHDNVYRIHAFRENYFIAYNNKLEVDLSLPIWDIMWLKFGRYAHWTDLTK